MRAWFLKQKGNSGEIARNRLRLVLISDETQVNPGFIERIREDFVNVLSRYADFDPGQVEFRLSRADASGERLPMLAARIPIYQFADLRIE